MTTSEGQRYQCPHCKHWFPVAVLNTQHQARNACGLVPQERRP